MKSALQGQGASKGAGLRILTETVSSPTLAAQIQQVLAAYPEASGSSGRRCRATTHVPAPGSRSAKSSSRSTTSPRPM